jgi:hypothetical protein
MRKVLLSTTALVAAGLLVTSVAYADEHEEMMMEEEAAPAEPVSVSIGGSYRAVIGGSSDDDTAMIWDHLEPVISGSATMDNGLTFGVSAVIDIGSSWFGSGIAYDRAITVGGAFGDIQIGAKRSARGQMRIASAGATSSFGLNGPYTAGSANASTTNNSPTGIENRAEKIVYMSPTISGIQVGASYAPRGAAVNEQMSVAATLTQGLGNASVSVNLGYETGDNGDGTSTEDLNAGLSISVDDITLSGGMLDSDNGMGGKAQITDIGATVAMGPLSLSAGWGSTDTTNMYALGASYPLGEGVALEAQLDFGDRPATDTQDDEWVQFMAGVAINF